MRHIYDVVICFLYALETRTACDGVAVSLMVVATALRSIFLVLALLLSSSQSTNMPEQAGGAKSSTSPSLKRQKVDRTPAEDGTGGLADDVNIICKARVEPATRSIFKSSWRGDKNTAETSLRQAIKINVPPGISTPSAWVEDRASSAGSSAGAGIAETSLAEGQFFLPVRPVEDAEGFLYWEKCCSGCGGRKEGTDAFVECRETDFFRVWGLKQEAAQGGAGEGDQMLQKGRDKLWTELDVPTRKAALESSIPAALINATSDGTIGKYSSMEDMARRTKTPDFKIGGAAAGAAASASAAKKPAKAHQAHDIHAQFFNYPICYGRHGKHRTKSGNESCIRALRDAKVPVVNRIPLPTPVAIPPHGIAKSSASPTPNAPAGGSSSGGGATASFGVASASSSVLPAGSNDGKKTRRDVEDKRAANVKLELHLHDDGSKADGDVEDSLLPEKKGADEEEVDESPNKKIHEVEVFAIQQSDQSETDQKAKESSFVFGAIAGHFQDSSGSNTAHYYILRRSGSNGVNASLIWLIPVHVSKKTVTAMAAYSSTWSQISEQPRRYPLSIPWPPVNCSTLNISNCGTEIIFLGEREKMNRPEDAGFVQNLLRGTNPRTPLESVEIAE